MNELTNAEVSPDGRQTPHTRGSSIGMSGTTLGDTSMVDRLVVQSLILHPPCLWRAMFTEGLRENNLEGSLIVSEKVMLRVYGLSARGPGAHLRRHGP